MDSFPTQSFYNFSQDKSAHSLAMTGQAYLRSPKTYLVEEAF